MDRADVLFERHAGDVGLVTLVAGEVAHLQVEEAAMGVKVSHLLPTVGTLLRAECQV